jgi:hypothetical protein
MIVQYSYQLKNGNGSWSVSHDIINFDDQHASKGYKEDFYGLRNHVIGEDPENRREFLITGIYKDEAALAEYEQMINEAQMAVSCGLD